MTLRGLKYLLPGSWILKCVDLWKNDCQVFWAIENQTEVDYAQ